MAQPPSANVNFEPWPCFSIEEADKVKSVLLSNKVNYWSGNECKSFEKAFAHYTDCEYAIAMANGTVALEVLLRGLEIGPGDEVIVTPRSFIASVSTVVGVGATPVFADISLDSHNIEAETIREKISPKTKAVIVVHLAGRPAEMDPIMQLAETHGFFVIEDCAQAHGARYKGRSVGSIGHAAAWSFCQDKIMTTGGEGGMVTTNSEPLFKKAWAYKDHGKSWSAVHEQDHPPGFRWLHESFGSNYRMTEMQAAIGRIQIEKMPEWHQKRALNAAALDEVLDDFTGVQRQTLPSHMTHAHYKYYFSLDLSRLREDWSRDRVIAELVASGVPCFQGSCAEIYREKAFEHQDFMPKASLPNAYQVGQTSVMLLVHPTLSERSINYCRERLSNVLTQAFKP